MSLLSAPDPNWPARAASAAEVWAGILKDDLLACHHIGSTSVPGLTAKPIIDLMPVARSIQALESAAPALQAQGYEAMGAFGLPGRRYFRKTDARGNRLIHAHGYAIGDPAIARHLAFRDLLRSDQNVRAAYADVKRSADAKAQGDIQRYMDLKDAFIKTHEALALQKDRPA